MDGSVHRLEDKNRITRLLDVYGALLTERQYEFLDLHCNEDLSYGEMAEMKDISRQAVHDAIQHGKRALERFEAHLKLVDAHQDNRQAGKTDSDWGELHAMLLELERRLQDDIIYDVDPLRRLVRNLKQSLFPVAVDKSLP